MQKWTEGRSWARECTRCLTFERGKQVFGVDALRIREIIAFATARWLWKAPQGQGGCLSLRGALVPVVDPGQEMPPASDNGTMPDSIIVVNAGHQQEAGPLGIIADTIFDVVEIGNDRIPDVFHRQEDGLVLRTVDIEQGTILLLGAEANPRPTGTLSELPV